MSTPPLVSAIILNYRTPHETLRCTDALLKQTIADQIEIIVVDNHSGDSSQKILRKLLGHGYPLKLLQTIKNLGWGQGNNFGAASAQGEHLLIINPDTTLDPHALEKMADYLQAHPDAGIIGPQLIFPDGTIRDSYRTFPTIPDVLIKRTFLRFCFPNRMRKYLQLDESPHETREVDWIVGACLFMRRELFESLGSFDSRYFLFFDDIDLCRRCKDAGKRVVFFAEAKAHDSQHRLSEGGIFSFFFKRSVRTHVADAIKYFWKWRKQRD